MGPESSQGVGALLCWGCSLQGINLRYSLAHYVSQSLLINLAFMELIMNYLK